ncbi:MAG: DNRLRE domain-containing protein, partial [Bacteroidota bacterium]
DGTNISGPMIVPVTGGWQEWTTVTSHPIPLQAGEQVIRLAMDASGFNVNYIKVEKLVTQPPAPDTQVVSLYPIHDAYLQKNGNQTKRYNNSLLRVEDGRRDTYLKFDLSSIPNKIIGATLTMTVSSDPGYGQFVVEEASHSNWTETNLSAGNAPAPVQQKGSLSGTFSVSNAYTWDLGELPNGGPVSLIVRHLNGNDAAFASKEVADPNLRPVLTLLVEGNTFNEQPTLVNWDGIEAEEVVDQTLVTWGVVEENNIQTYVLERSLDGLLFEDHHEQFSMGSSKTAHTYTAMIPTETDLNMTFRVRAKGKDGFVSYSPPFTLQANDPNAKMTLFPNPLESDQVLQIALEMPKAESVHAAIFDYQGSLRLSKSHTFSDDKGTLDMNIQTLPPGVYIVSVWGTNWILSETVVVE